MLLPILRSTIQSSDHYAGVDGEIDQGPYVHNFDGCKCLGKYGPATRM